MDQSHRIVLTLTRRHAKPGITLSDEEGSGRTLTESPLRRILGRGCGQGRGRNRRPGGQYRDRPHLRPQLRDIVQRAHDVGDQRRDLQRHRHRRMRPRFPAMAAGVAPLLAAADAATGRFYVTDFGSAEVTVLDGSRCNASVTSGCGAAVREQAAGSQPVGLAVSPQTSTVYVADTFQAGSKSVRWLARDTSHARASLAPELPHRHRAASTGESARRLQLPSAAVARWLSSSGISAITVVPRSPPSTSRRPPCSARRSDSPRSPRPPESAPRPRRRRSPARAGRPVTALSQIRAGPACFSAFVTASDAANQTATAMSPRPLP